jgi:hypothetical protein
MAMPREIRLIDRLHRGSPHPSWFLTAQAAPWPSSIDAVIDVSGAVEYYTSVATHNGMLLKEFPTLAPPFPCFWLETVRPPFIRAGDKITSNAHDPLEWGALFQGEKISSGFHVKIDFAIRLTHPEMLCFPTFSTKIVLDAQGHAIPWSSGKYLAHLVSPDVLHEHVEHCLTEMTPLLGSLLFAVSLMHCKNVCLREEKPNPKLSKAGEQRGHPPLLRYQVLEIEPMKKILKTDGQAATEGLKRALHICRGHFKDYRQSGLFGKHKDVFWWDMAARGSAEIGIVDKDYSIEAPHAS